ncbi:MAG: hypothetical protein JNL88_08180, partial [Bacteroidia bacterium]|nr:hypothetical protein [Bacteroidia bacterium]
MYNVYINERLLRFVGAHDSVSGVEMVLKLRGDEPSSYLKVLVDSFEENPLTASLVLQSA